MTAYAPVTYTGDGSQTTFTFSWTYLKTSYVKVYVGGVLTTATVTPGQVVLASAPGSGVTVQIIRETEADTRLVDFQGGSTVVEDNLDLDSDQQFHILQERASKEGNYLAVDDTLNIYNAGARRITNVADGTAAQDAATKAQLDALTISSGNVTSPGSSFTGKVLSATSATAYDWSKVSLDDLSEITGPTQSFIDDLLNADDTATARTAIGVGAASDSAAGIVELATTAETTTGTATDLAVTPDGLKDMTSLAGAAWFLDEDDMASDSSTQVASQQSIKAYVTSSVAASPTPTVLLLDTEITGNPSSITFEDSDGMDWSTYRYFEVSFGSFVSVAMQILVTMSQGSSYQTAYAYGSTGVTFTAGSNHASTAILCPHGAEIYKGSSGYDEGFHLSGQLHGNITDGTDKMGPFFHWRLGANVASGGYAGSASGTGWLANGVDTAIDGIKFAASTGTFVDGYIKIWGVK